jgi:hypothetical protein
MRATKLLAALAFLVGCSTVDPDSGVETGALTGSVGVLHVERSGLDGNGRTVLRAAFARYQGIEGDAVLRLLGSRSAAELGSCELVDPSGATFAPDADVELLDVGGLYVSMADAEARLSPRTFPDLASVLAGVFYAGDAALPMARPEIDEYRFEAEGGDEVGAFDVVVPAPAEPSGLTLLGADGTSAVLDGRLTEVARSGSLTLQWDSEDPRDLFELELSSGDRTLACLSRDEGSFRIAGEDIAMLQADPEARLLVRRVRISPFDAPGIDAAFARVAAAISIPVALR